MKGRQIAALIRLSWLYLCRRKEVWVIALLAGILLVPLAMMQPFGVQGASRYLNELTLLLIWVFSLIIGCLTASKLFPPEFESRTIYPLLAKPISYQTLVLGKYLGAFLTSAATVGLFYVLYGLFCGMRQGIWFPCEFFQAGLLHLCAMAVLTALVTLGSLVMTPAMNLILNVLVCIGMVLYGAQLPALAAEQGPALKAVLWFAHVLLPHMEFFDMRQRLVHQWGALSWSVVGVVALYALLYSAAALILATLALKRKKL